MDSVLAVGLKETFFKFALEQNETLFLVIVFDCHTRIFF